MTKFKAAFIHLLISILVVGVFLAIVITVWYPKPFFDISGVIAPIKLLIMIDVIVGPCLTFVVYKSNKKYLRLDLLLIAIMQIAAIFYGAYTIYGGRPSMVVMHNSQFHYLSEKFSNHDQLEFKQLKPSYFTKPQIAYIDSTESLDIYSAYADMLPVDNYEKSLLAYSLSIENVKAKFKGKVDEIDVLVSKYNSQDIAFFELDKDGSKYYVIFSISQNSIIDYLKF